MHPHRNQPQENKYRLCSLSRLHLITRELHLRLTLSLLDLESSSKPIPRTSESTRNSENFLCQFGTPKYVCTHHLIQNKDKPLLFELFLNSSLNNLSTSFPLKPHATPTEDSQESLHRNRWQRKKNKVKDNLGKGNRKTSKSLQSLISCNFHRLGMGGNSK